MSESGIGCQPHDLMEHESDRVGTDWAYLSDLVEVNPRTPSPTDGETVSFIAMADVSESGVIASMELREGCSGYTPFAIGDVLVAKITPCFENGKGAHVRDLPTRYGLGSTEFHVLRPRSTTSDRYLYHLTRTSRFRLQGEGLMSGSAGQRRVPTEFFGRYTVRVPPLGEQRRIAEILDTLDETIQATERVITKLIVVARATQDRLVSSASGRSVTLASIAALSGGHGFPEDEQGRQSGPLPFYKVSDMNSIGNEKFLDKANNYVQPETAERNGWRVLPPGAVVFAKVGAALLSNRRRILRVRSIIDNNMMAAVPRQVVSTDWLYRWLQTVDFARFVQVGALPSVNQGLVGGLRLDLPTLCEQERQADVLDAHDSRINAEIAQLAKYKRIRAGLATDLLSGRVRTVAA